jgi:segregation and condensation protein B
MQEDDPAREPSEESTLSLSRLRQAFAAMLEPARRESSVESQEPAIATPARCAGPKPCEINPRTVVEAILFVGRPDNRAFSARELAAAMRGVSPGEIDAAVRELNTLYDADETPYHVESSSSGYRLALRDQFARMRDKFYGRVREATLSPAAIEVLSIVAYNQPVTADAINELRGAANGAALSTLVRRRLIRLDRAENGAPPRYTTTERFLKLFGLQGLDALPRSEELEKV